MWDGQTVTTFPDVPGLTENEIYSVTEDRNGNIWICATRHGVGVSTLVSYSKYGAAMVGEVKTLNDLDKLDHDWWFISC